MGCVCCLQTPCVSLCRMPQELEATIVSNGVVSTVNWSISAAEIADIESFIEGTYALQYQTYASNYAEYFFYFPDPPYDYLGSSSNILRYRWFCNYSGFVPNRVAGGMFINACSTTSTELYRRFQGGVPFYGGNAREADGFPSITDYCSGSAFSSVLNMQCQFFPDTACANSPGSDRAALFDFDVTLTD